MPDAGPKLAQSGHSPQWISHAFEISHTICEGKIQMRRLLGVLVLALLLYRPAHAEMTVQEYLGTPATGTKHDVTVLWLSGIELGLSWANIFYQHEGFPPLYCPPEHVALTHDEVVSILDEYLKCDE